MLAQPVHGINTLVRLALLSLLAAGGCVIPPDLSVATQDAGVNSPPAILGVRTDLQELPEPGPVIFDRGPGTFNAELIDTDVNDELYVRVFVDYKVDDPKPARVSCTAPANGTANRTVSCDTRALCQMEDLGVTRNMQIMVFDREPLEAGDPQYQAMEPGGLSTSRFYFLQCMEPS